MNKEIIEALQAIYDKAEEIGDKEIQDNVIVLTYLLQVEILM